ncbi:MAG: AsmA-like C-terminal region-containing protein, partial [Nitrospirae bacterium]|nr:AsmA-like C-terminal region-containing protein [Nitrospirota bacterium]
MIRKKRIAAVIVVLLLSSFCVYFLRGQYVSERLKLLLLSEIAMATGKSAEAERIYINPFPFYIGMKNMTLKDENGRRLLSISKAKGYIDIPRLLLKKAAVTRLLIKAPAIESNREDAEEIIKTISEYISTARSKKIDVDVESIAITNGSLSFFDKDSRITAENISANIALYHLPAIKLSSPKVRFAEGATERFQGRFESRFIVKKGLIDLRQMKVVSHGQTESRIAQMPSETKHMDTRRFVDRIQGKLGLREKAGEEIAVKGILDFSKCSAGLDRCGYQDVLLDLRIKGAVYLETLMGALKVDEKLTGHMRFSGGVRGYMNDLAGTAKAELKNGNLFDVEVDRLNCDVIYANTGMGFKNGDARLYGGTAQVEAAIELPVVNTYRFAVKAEGVSSKSLFKLIGWDPNIQEGKVTGNVSSSGSRFNPEGDFHYKAKSTGDDILGRIKTVKGAFKMTNGVINLSSLHISSEASRLSASGRYDLSRKTLDFKGIGETDEIMDFSSPYFTALTGQGSFNVSLTGITDDPVLELGLSSKKAIFSTSGLDLPTVFKNRAISINSIDGSLIYKKNLLIAKDIVLKAGNEDYRIAGNINFRKANELFELGDPDYALNISARNLNIKPLAETFQNGPAFGGSLNVDFRLTGTPDDIRADGEFSALDFSWDNDYKSDAITGRSAYYNGAFMFDGVVIKKGGSIVNASGKITLDKAFSLAAATSHLGISDIAGEDFVQMTGTEARLLKKFSMTNVMIKGEGTLEKPNIRLTSDFRTLKDVIEEKTSQNGAKTLLGQIKAVLTGRHVDINVELLDGKFRAAAAVELTERLPWSADIKLMSSRYEFLIAPFLRDAPEDLLLNMNGVVTARGDRNHIKADAFISRAALKLYGVNFVNAS